jgi:signal transduction histidine kinase
LTGVQQHTAWARLRLRAHPVALDAALAAAVLGMILGTMYLGPHARRYDAGPVDVVISVLACGSLLLRRRRPLAVLVFTSAVTLGYVVVRAAEGAKPPVALTAVVALYTVAAHTDRHTTTRAAVPVCLGLTAATTLFGAGPWYSAENIGLFAWAGMAAAVGDAVRSHRSYIAAIQERAERAERTREEEARRRVAEERMRIARELHDVVAHHIALVNVQAGVAAHVMDSRPDQAKQALAHVRDASRSALDELRATVGLLRQSGDPEAPMEPAPGLGVLDQLVDGFRRAGLTVDVTMAPEAEPPLPASADLTVYRVIQESLTNVHKHAGARARAEVRIARQSDAVEVTVVDDGGRDAKAPVESGAGGGVGGHGLMGMRERAAALGGTCEAGPRTGSGFRVRVRLPLTTAAPAAATAESVSGRHCA